MRKPEPKAPAATPGSEKQSRHPVSLRGVSKDFGGVRALDSLDLLLDEGEIHGFLGPNGAGKSTTIKILFGLLTPTAGSALVLGSDPRRDAVALHRRMAYVPGDVALWPSLTGGECIDLLIRMRGHRVDRRRRDNLIARFDLDPRKRSRAYSKGNRQKVALIAAFAVPSELIVLDEPSSGLDPLMEQVFRQVVAEAAVEGATVLLSSHILSEVEELCDRLTIIRQGSAVTTGTLAEMRHRTFSRITAKTARDVRGLAEVASVQGGVTEGRVLDFSVSGASIGAALTCLADAGIESLVSKPPTLEELFLEHYGDEVSATPQNGPS